jgi:hypothetical protein
MEIESSNGVTCGEINSSGSLGCFARLGDRDVLLTCSHVLFPGFRVVANQAVYQPYFSSCCSGGDRFAAPITIGEPVDGKTFGGFTGSVSLVDCGIADLDEKVKFANIWVDGTAIKGVVKSGLGVVKGPKLEDEPSAEQLVKIYTPRLGRVIQGTLLADPTKAASNADPDKVIFAREFANPDDDAAGTRTLTNQFLVMPRPGAGNQASIDHGDSGSVVLNHENRIVGMVARKYPLAKLFATLPEELLGVEFVAVVTPIGAITKHLGITIPDDFSGTASSGPRVQVSVPDPDRQRQRSGIDRLRSGLATSRRGRVLIAKVERHQREVRRLFQRVRELAALWRRHHGPAFFHHGVQNAQRPEHVVPDRIDDVSRAQLVEAVLPVLLRHASPPLRRDLERYRDWASALLLEVRSLDDVPAAVARPWTGA